MSVTVALVVGGLLLALIAGRRNIGRFYQAIRAQVNQAGIAAAEADPVAMLRKQVDDSNEDLKRIKVGLAQYKAQMASLERRVDQDAHEVQLLEARARGYVAKGDDAGAARALEEKQRINQSLTANAAQLKLYRDKYEAGRKQVDYIGRKIEDAKHEAIRLKADLDMSQVEKRLAETALDFQAHAPALDGIGESRELILRQIDANRAAAQTTNETGNGLLTEIEDDNMSRQGAVSDELAKLKAEIASKN